MESKIMENTVETPKLELETIDVNSLPELQGWKEKQLQIVKDCPFVKITDHKTYEEGKKNRTKLVTARTDIEKQDKLVASKLKDFRSKVSQASKELIAITQPHEEAQQAEVKQYEAAKRAEKEEKERLERERKEKIKEAISLFAQDWQQTIADANIQNIEKLCDDLDDALEKQRDFDWEEFELEFEDSARKLKSVAADRFTVLIEKENARVEAERLAKEREQLEAEKRQLEAAQKKAKEEAERQAKIKAEQEAKEAAERKAKEEAEKQRLAEEAEKRTEALKPDVEKLTAFIESIDFTTDQPELKEVVSKQFLSNLKIKLGQFKTQMDAELANIK